WGDRKALRMAEKVFGSGVGQIAETDMAVSIPSARPGCIYLKPKHNQATDIKINDFTHFNESKLKNLFIVQAPHLSFAQEDFYDMAEVPLACRDLHSPCTHPTYGLILALTMLCTDEILQCNQGEYIRHVTS